MSENYQVFKGIKVLDFTWAVVGPLTTKMIADHGGTVIKIESLSKPDITRSNAPFIDGIPGINRSQFFATYNTNKLSLGIDLRTQAGRDIARLLVDRWQPDIVAESFAPGTMTRWGLDYEDLRHFKADLIYFSTTQLGQTGPYARYSGFGNLAAAIAGLHHVTGWPDRVPVGPYGALPDVLAPPLALTAIIAALDYRRREGVGQRVDVGQIQSALQFMAPALLLYQGTGVTPGRRGNRDDSMVPHGVFPCRGEDRWIAIAVRDEHDWQALRTFAADQTWAQDSRFATNEGRKRFESELERAIASWTGSWDAHQLMDALQHAGVPAGLVADSRDLAHDEHLAATGFFLDVEHPEGGTIACDSLPFSLSQTPARVSGPPALGQHTHKVLTELLDFSDAHVADLLEQGVVQIS